MSVDEIIDFIVNEATMPNHQRKYVQIGDIFDRLNIDYALREQAKEKIESIGLFEVVTNQGYRIRSNYLSESISKNGGYLAWIKEQEIREKETNHIVIKALRSASSRISEPNIKPTEKKRKIKKWQLIITIVGLVSALITIYDFLDKRLIIQFITDKILPFVVFALFCSAIRANNVIFLC